MKKLFITLLAALTLFAAVPQMCFAEEPTTPPTVEQGEGEEGDENLPEIEPTHINGPAGDNN
ncbi:hypothetical protein [Negativibacillus massiliensis]|uniref:hypothetical protein n=1 Tax=Negativibacillus massiliensis TaxID=1871035 RepID=UPI003AF23FD8